jgi:hypothetical protein
MKAGGISQKEMLFMRALRSFFSGRPDLCMVFPLTGGLIIKLKLPAAYAKKDAGN